ncbi:MAG: transposase [Deltaproteobacteria bacterium]|nr:transposase [Deltaproteobacteria bacterium]
MKVAMPRIARIVGLGYPHHVIQRGNNREKAFLDDEDFKKYLSLLEKYLSNKEVVLQGYCLMTNHVHLLLKPLKEQSLYKMIQGITLCYTQYFNKKYSRTGRLWECRYHSCIVDAERYLWAVSRYIERNPVRAKMVENPEDYCYSSARSHILGEANQLVGEPLFGERELSQYKLFVKRKEKEEELEDIRKKTRLGKPLGGETFLRLLSEKLGRTLTFRPKGRPAKKEGG